MKINQANWLFAKNLPPERGSFEFGYMVCRFLFKENSISFETENPTNSSPDFLSAPIQKNIFKGFITQQIYEQ
jgi:hypothetical protein